MSTRHEAAAAAFAALVAAAVPCGVSRGDARPARCPAEGLAWVSFEDPEEVGRRLGTGVREFEREANVTIVVQDPEDGFRRGLLEDRIEALGAALAGAALSAPLDHIEIGGLEYDSDVNVEAAAPISAATVAVTLFYETPSNTLEDL